MNFVTWFIWCLIALQSYVRVKAGGHGGHHVKIIIPKIVHTHKHTHTVYKTIHHGKSEGGGGGHDFHSHGGKPFHWH